MTMTTAPVTDAVTSPFDVPPATLASLQRSAAALREAMATTDVGLRYALAHVAALRATAALLSTRARPAPGRRSQRNAWVLLAELAPEFAEWATFFSAGAAKRAAAEAGSRTAVTAREADDLIREADTFLALIESSLGLTRHAPFGDRLAVAPTAWSGVV